MEKNYGTSKLSQIILFLLALCLSPVGQARELSEEEIAAATAEAKAGNINAQFLLAVWYREKNQDARAEFWLLQAAERGDEEAQRIIGIGFYNSGDVFQASSWLTKAAQGGDTLAQYFLGTMYADGKGVPFNMKEALAWCYLAEAKEIDDPDIRKEIAEAVKRMESELPPEVAAAAKEEAKAQSLTQLEQSAKKFVDARDGEEKLIPVTQSEPGST